MRVHVVDPSAFTPPYDHALCRALGAAGAEVELYTSRFAYGPTPAPDGYARRELFYRRAHRGDVSGSRSRGRLALKLAEHVPDMLRYRALATRAADIVHFQWLTVQPLDVHLLPRRPAARGGRPKLVLSAHDVLPREPRPGQLAAQRRLYERVDAIVVHSEHGRDRLVGELTLDPAKIHVIPHGALRPWEAAGSAQGGDEGAGASSAGGAEDPKLPRELREAAGHQGGEHARPPVVLLFGLLRPYKGIDVLLDAWARLGRDTVGGDGASVEGPQGAARGGPAATDRPAPELWIVGMPRMDLAPIHAGIERAHRAGAGPVRLLPRFVTDSEIHALLGRASLVVLPYREIDQSGVLFTALGAGTPLLLSDVGGFPELARDGAARVVPAGDPAALAGALGELLGDPPGLERLASRARELAREQYSWTRVGAGHLALYESLLAD